MRKRTVLFLCLLSTILGSVLTIGIQAVFSDTSREGRLSDKNSSFPFLTKTNPPLTNLPADKYMEDHFFSDFFGEEHFSQMIGSEISQRSDENYIYFDLPLKETEQSKIQTNLVDGYIEISGEITERMKTGSNGESIMQRSFSQMLPLPKEADPSTLQIISEPKKTVIRFDKRRDR